MEATSIKLHFLSKKVIQNSKNCRALNMNTLQKREVILLTTGKKIIYTEDKEKTFFGGGHLKLKGSLFKKLIFVVKGQIKF